MFIRKIITCVLLSLATLSAASAQGRQIYSTRAFEIGAWKGTVSRYKDDGAFSHCSMGSSYNSGITLMFFMNDPSSWRIGFLHSNWKLVPGNNYPVQYWVDRSRAILGTTKAMDSTIAFLDLPSNSNLFQQFRTGRVLSVDFAGQRFNFNLTGTSAALNKLFECTKINYGTRVGGVGTGGDSNNPFSTNAKPEPRRVEPAPEPRRELPPPPPPPPQPRANNSPNEASMEDRLEATRMIANMLSQSDFQGYEIMSHREMQSEKTANWIKSALVAWRAPNLLGTLHIFPGVDGDTDLVMARALGADAATCKGQFISGKDPAADASLRTVFTICKTDDESSFKTSYIFMARKDGVVFRFATVTKLSSQGGGDDHSKQEERKLRDALKNTPI